MLGTACGRIGFAAVETDSVTDADEALRTEPCPHAVVAVDPLHITGRTITYTNFMGALIVLMRPLE